METLKDLDAADLDAAVLMVIGAYTVLVWIWDWFGWKKYHPWPKSVKPEPSNHFRKCCHCGNPLATETLCSWCGWKPKPKEPTIPERRVKRFELLQVVADLYANKSVTLHGEHAGYWGEVVDYLHARGVAPKDIKVQNSSTTDHVRIRLEVDCDHRK